MNNKLNLPIFTCAAAILLPHVCWADSDDLQPPSNQYRGTNCSMPWQGELDGSYTASGSAKFQGVKRGNSAAANLSVEFSAPVRLNETWECSLGLRSQNVFLDSVPAMPVPKEIHTLAFNAGIKYQLNDDWTLMGVFNPALYKLSDLGGKDIGFSGGIIAMWRYSHSLRFVAGIMVAPDNDISVLPMVGVDWQINERWDLRLTAPQPRLVFNPNEHLGFYVGANLVDDTFRSSQALGTSIGKPQYNDALASYLDLRVGTGFSYSISKSASVELEGGYSVERQISYKHFDTVRFNPAPYVRLGINLKF